MNLQLERFDYDNPRVMTGAVWSSVWQCKIRCDEKDYHLKIAVNWGRKRMTMRSDLFGLITSGLDEDSLGMTFEEWIIHKITQKLDEDL